MASRKMTFTIPDDLASRFVGGVPARDRSRYVADALAEKLARHDRQLIRACAAANASPAVREIEREFDALTDGIAEPWEDAPAR